MELSGNTVEKTFINITVPKNTRMDTHKTRKPRFP